MKQSSFLTAMVLIKAENLMDNKKSSIDFTSRRAHKPTQITNHIYSVE